MSDLIVDRHDKVLLLRFNRPQSLNAFGGTLLEEYVEALEEARRDDRVHVIVTTGEGRGFCAGADLARIGQSGAADDPANRTLWDRFDPRGRFGRMVILMHEIDKPMVAAVNGAAAGAGFAICLHHDYRIAADTAKFTTTYMNVGLAPDANLSYVLPRAVGWPVASDLFFTARMVMAEEALRLGIVQQLAPAERLVESALEYAQAIAARPPMAVQFTKRALRRSWLHSFEEHVEFEWMCQRWHGETGVSRYAAADFLAARKKA